jgi:hypothetical protein
MNMKKYPLFAIVLLGSLLVGCTDDFDGFYEFDEYTPSVIMQANQLIESGKIKVSLLDLERAYMSETSKNSKANSKRDFSIEWSDYRVKTEGTVDVVYVPIKLNKKKNQIFTLQTEDGRMKGFSHQFYCTLIMASGKDGKGFEAVMATYLYGGNMKENDIKRMGRDFESAGYSGYYITSTLDGTMLSGRYFEDGECKFRFRQNPLPPSERKELVTKAKPVAESDTILKHDHHGLHIFLNVNPLKRARMTKGSNDDMEWLMTHCSLCGKFYEDCTCVTVEDYPLCQYCHTDIINGRCGQACFYCDLCTKGPYHTHPYYSPEWGGGYTPPSTGGGGGGNTGGGNNYYGGDAPTPNTPTSHATTSENVTNKGHLALKYIKDTDNGSMGMRCNQAVQKCFEYLYDTLPSYLNVNANTMVANLASSDEWSEIIGTLSEMLSEAQKKANDGYMVIAGAQDFSGSEPHGHVVVILPGKLVGSTSWHMDVPGNVLECGINRRWDNKGLSNSWVNDADALNRPAGSADKDDIRFFYYK